MFFFAFGNGIQRSFPQQTPCDGTIVSSVRTLGMAPSMLGMFLNEISGISFFYSLEVGNLDLLQLVGKKYNNSPIGGEIGGEQLAFAMVESVKHHQNIKNSRNMVVPLGWWYTLSKMVKLVNQATKKGAWTSYSSPSMHLLRRYWKPLSQATQNQVDWSTRVKPLDNLLLGLVFSFRPFRSKMSEFQLLRLRSLKKLARRVSLFDLRQSEITIPQQKGDRIHPGPKICWFSAGLMVGM